MPIVKSPKISIGKMDYCDCSQNRLNGWPVRLSDKYCSGCGTFLYSLDFVNFNIDPNCGTKTALFFIKSDGKSVQIQSNLQVRKKTYNSKSSTINYNDPAFFFCKEAELSIVDSEEKFYLFLNEELANKGVMSFSISPESLNRLILNAPVENFKRVLFKCYKSRKLPGPKLECEGIFGPFPEGNPFEIQISGELPVIVNDCLKWKFTSPNLNHLIVTWKARYPFKLFGVFLGDKKPFHSFEKKDYVTGEQGKFAIKLIDEGKNVFQFKFIVNIAGVDKSTSVFEYKCEIEKVDSDLISLIPGNTDCKIPIKSGGVVPYEAIVILKKKSGYDLQITDIQFKDEKSCVKLTSNLPVSIKNERTSLLFSVQTMLFNRVTDINNLYPVDLVIHDNKGNKWYQKLDLTLNREDALDHYLAIDWGTTNTCFTIFDPRTGVFKQLTDHGKKFIPAITSRFAIRKVDVDNKKYDLLVGSADSLKTDFQERPECIISSLKRRFYDDPQEMQVIDADHNYFTVPVLDLVVQYLQALIIAVEDKSPFEFKKIGFSYPTKIKKKHYSRLIEMLNKLELSLQKIKPGVSVTTLPNYHSFENTGSLLLENSQVGDEDLEFKQKSHTPDEACSVAIEYYNTHELVAEVPQVFVIYDFGGGTIDSAVLEIFQDGEKFSSRLIGISGTHQFGGDDITNAMVQMVKEKLFKIDPKVYIPIFDEQAKKDVTDIGKKNRAILFEFMEKLKKDFKGAGEKESPISFFKVLSLIKCENGKSAFKNLFKDNVEPNLSQKNNLQFFSSEVYDWEIGPKNGENSGLKIKHVIQRSVDEILNICEMEKVKPSKVILAGQGCNLPLVRDIFNKRFPGLVDFDKDKAKTRLSVGLSHFLNSYDFHNNSLFSKFSPVPLVNHFAIGLRDNKGSFEKLLDVGNFLHTSEKKQLVSFSLNLSIFPKLDLFRKNFRTNQTEKIGTFNFRNAELVDKSISNDLFDGANICCSLDVLSGFFKAYLFFHNFNSILLVLNRDDKYFGFFRMSLSSDYFDLQNAVQGR